MEIDLNKYNSLLEAYKKDFKNLIKLELYKWKDIKHFQAHWDIDAENFVAMLDKALPKSNYLDSRYFYPRGMILELAKSDPKGVREMFRSLFDESKDLQKRMEAFAQSAEAIRKEHDPGDWKNHYQDPNSISVYLWLRYPDTHFLYKFSEAKALMSESGIDYKFPRPSFERATYAFKAFRQIRDILATDSELKEMLSGVLDENCYPDPNYTTLTGDVAHYAVSYYNKAKGNVPTHDIKRSWLCAVGENGSKWDECYSEGVVRLGWDPVGVLSQFATREDIVTRLQEVYGRNETFTNDSLALWEFVHEMNVGDIVYAKKGRSTIIGKGVIESDYYYDEALDTYRNARKVRWTNRGEWVCSSPFAMKTLTEFTNYPDFLSEIENLIKGGQKEIKDDVPEIKDIDVQPDSEELPKYWWLNANPKIWKMSEWKVGEEQEYTLYNENGSKRRIFQNFLDAQEGQVVICYETNPVKKITNIATVSKAADGQRIAFRKIRTLSEPVSLATIKSVPELENLEVLSNSRGSFFKVTDKEYEAIMCLIRENNDDEQESLDSPSYSESDFLNEVFMAEDVYHELVELLKTKKNVILQGAPGVGKTFCAERLAYSIIGKRDSRRIKTIQFHQSYSYEDFIMGYKPAGETFKLRNGVFYNFCIEAANNPEEDYFFIIDEINRGNLSKIFGELLMMIEKDYRGKEVALAYSDQGFHVPENLYIIGMMNTADRSLALIDYALRRRFSFFDMKPGFKSEGFKNHIKSAGSVKLEKVINIITELNDDIRNDDSLGCGFEIGHSYFCGNGGPMTDSHVRRVIKYDIIPTIQEYWFDNEKKAKEWSEKLIKAIND